MVPAGNVSGGCYIKYIMKHGVVSQGLFLNQQSALI